MIRISKEHLVILCISVLISVDAREEAQPRIIGGKVSRIKDEKYLMLVTTDSEVCGGSLITPLWVITAAHCVKNVQKEDLRIYGGASNQQGPHATLRYVDLIVIRPDFNENTMNMDAAALRLQSEMVGANIETIALATQPVPARKLVKVSGWGSTTRGSSITVKRVRTVMVPVWSQASCRKIYRGIQTITRSMMCAAKPYRKDSCDGDSGGPLVYKGELSGIVSFGYGCATRLPGVYTSVPQIRNWFLNVVKDNTPTSSSSSSNSTT